MLRRIQNRITQVSVVDQYLRTIRQLQLRSVNPRKVRSTCSRAARVTSVATHAGKESLAVLRQRHAAGRLLSPLGIVIWTQHSDFANHRRVIRSAVLCAEDMVGPWS